MSDILTLLPHQQKFVIKFKELGKRVLLADEPGLGKTFSSLSAYYYYNKSSEHEHDNILIITPPSLINTWIENIQMLDDNVNKSKELLYILVISLNKNDITNGKYDNNIINITFFEIENIDLYLSHKNKYKYIIISNTSMIKYIKNKNNNNNIEKQFFNLILSHYIIIDEVHFLKNPDKETNKYNILILNIIKLMELYIFYTYDSYINIILITATPITTDPSELYNYFYLIDKNAMISEKEVSDSESIEELMVNIDKKYNEFLKECDILYKTKIHWNIDIIKKKLQTFMVRRSINFLSINVPLKIINKIAIKINSSDNNNNNNNLVSSNNDTDEIVEDSKSCIPEDDKKRIKIGKLKAKYIVDSFIPKLLIESKLPNKIIIFFYFRKVGDYLHHNLINDIGIHSKDIYYIDGSIDMKLRHGIINNFKNHDKSCIFLVSLHTCSQGIDLVTSFCSHMIFCEIDYTPSILLQAEGRLIRINNIFCQHIYIWYFIGIDENNEDYKTDRSSDYFIMNEFLNSKNNLINTIIKLYNY